MFLNDFVPWRWQNHIWFIIDFDSLAIVVSCPSYVPFSHKLFLCFLQRSMYNDLVYGDLLSPKYSLFDLWGQLSQCHAIIKHFLIFMLYWYFNVKTSLNNINDNFLNHFFFKYFIAIQLVFTFYILTYFICSKILVFTKYCKIFGFF